MKYPHYNTIIVGGGAGGLFAAYEFAQKAPENYKVALLEKGHPLSRRKCPIDGVKVKNCINCPSCSIMNGIGGAGAFSDGKYNITTKFGGDMAEYIGEKNALDLMEYVDQINVAHGGAETKRYSTGNTTIKAEALKYDIHLLDAEVRHLGTDRNYQILANIVSEIEDRIEISTGNNVRDITKDDNIWRITTDTETITADNVILSTGRSGSQWTSNICEKLGVKTYNNRVDIGIRFECPADIWENVTSQAYEAKLVYRSPKTGCTCRTFCMNPHGHVVAENTNGIITVNGHSYDDPALQSNNTNFALLVTHEFTEPFHDSNAYGEHIARLTNMLGEGVMVQRFGDLVANKRTNAKRLSESFTTPTLAASPGNLALSIPKMTLDTIIEMIYALDKLVPGTANQDNLLYGTEVKFYNSKVEVDGNLMALPGLYVIGDASGTTHSLSQASAEGVYVARNLCESTLI